MSSPKPPFSPCGDWSALLPFLLKAPGGQFPGHLLASPILRRWASLLRSRFSGREEGLSRPLSQGEMSVDAAAGVPLPRLCCLEKGPNSYGFHLHGEKGKVGQYIRLAGLLAGDRLVEVNGENVGKVTHPPRSTPCSCWWSTPRRTNSSRSSASSTGQAEPPAAAEAQGAGNENEPSEANKSHPEQLSRARAAPAGIGSPGRPAPRRLSSF
ncbi:hypothetical protein P7K49_010407 [Saguinus oedipus]|uniref:PDZ domain-containing protein n=1 Tax=Saguinus oedipus TaxID=9490 RepID=A0ABQ9VNG5_SAGOE|nr:hypothetical protein P7K49_010407 [Saguinus oedipus]